MWQIYQFPLCPFSRKIRLQLGEKGVPHELVRENPWERRDEFIDLNPAGQVPVMVEVGRGTVLIDSAAIAEYFEETVELAPMLPGASAQRAEIRRLTAWLDERFWQEVTAPLLGERMYKRLLSRQAPDTGALREATPSSPPLPAPISKRPTGPNAIARKSRSGIGGRKGLRSSSTGHRQRSTLPARASP